MSSPFRYLSVRTRGRRLRLAASAALLAVVALSGSAVVPAGASSEAWIVTANTATVLGDLDAEVATHMFTGPGAYVLGGRPGALTAMGFSSYATFAGDVASEAIPEDVRVVMYDPESWAATPVDEQQDPVRFMRDFASLAHRAGYLVIFTPHPNLTAVPGAACPKRDEESIQDAYLRCRLPAEAAALGDILDVQAQFLEPDLAAYRSITVRAAHQAREANPDIVVTAHLSTAFATAPETLFVAWNLVRGEVDGAYLGVPAGVRAEIAIAFLRMVEAAGG